MYGTVNALCTRLQQHYKADELMTLIIWTKEDVQKVLRNEHITEETAAEIVCDLAKWDRDAQHETGVGAETLRAIADGIRYAAGKRNRPVTIAASDLDILAGAVGRYLDMGSEEDSGAIEEAVRRAHHAIKQ